jgi:uncharacterized protein DUF6046
VDNVYNIPHLEGLRFWNVKLSKSPTYKQRFFEAHANGIPMVLPVRFKLESWSDWWTLPIEPLVSISGGNVVAKRSVAKASHRGTIKERWTQDDYKITIQGIFINSEDESEFPQADLIKLREVCEAREAVQIECDLFLYFDIYRMVIETYHFPFTSGENQQEYSIKAVSDDLTDILTEEEQL